MFPFYSKYKKKKTSDTPKVRKKSKPNLVAKLDKVFALYIRLRDVMPSGYGRCISCGKIKPFAELDCGHFHGRTHMSTRFDEDNCHAECRGCNRASSDHLIGYQENLIKKIGIARYDTLKLKAKSVTHWQDFELEEKIRHYRNEVLRLSKEKGIRVNI